MSLVPLLLKLGLTPLLILAASLTARRWGAGVGGWLAGFPFTSAPVALLLALEQGPAFAAVAAEGILLGVLAQAVFALAYGLLALRGVSWPWCVAAGSAAFAACTLACWAGGGVPLPLAALGVLIGLAVSVRVMPATVAESAAVRPPRWDLPGRVVVATALVVVLTSVASVLGARLSGLVTPFPLYACVLAVFAHAQAGSGAGVAVWRGLLSGLFGFGAFALVLAVALVPLGVGWAFLLAVGAVFGVQLAVLRGLDRRRAHATIRT